MEPLTAEDFQSLQSYIQQHYGIDLHKKSQLISSRLAVPISQIGYTSFHDYVLDIISGRRPDLVNPMLARLTTNYTYFMREEAHFQFLQSTVLPWIEKQHRNDHCVNIWSAGCSSGEEPYNLSMYVMDYFQAKGSWDTRILATDISTDMLQRAVNPVYSAENLNNLPAGWKSRYFTRRPDGLYTVAPRLRKNVLFRIFNLMDPIHFRKKFDLICCRNVMIYFNQSVKDALIQRFYGATVPGGYLFIGHSEGVNRNTCPYEYIKPAIYRKKV
ncbi:MAG: protein-glutamate O-methyltransferase CheR [Eubacterium sp.]|nr:protein-glutamate O-methyltransferase CheR [Eubacterium sp.]